MTTQNNPSTRVLVALALPKSVAALILYAESIVARRRDGRPHDPVTPGGSEA